MKLPLLVIVLSVPCAAIAQTLSLGIKGGIPLTEAFDTANFAGLSAGGTTKISYTSRAKTYTVGPAVEVSLPLGLAVEFDALYKRLNYNSSSSVSNISFAGIQEQHNIISRWDLPLLIKYRVRRFALTPYISGGINTNYIVNTTEISRAGFVPLGAPLTLGPPIKSGNPPAELRHRSSKGGVISGGFEFRYRRIRLAPELRYTRWAHENFHETALGRFRSNLHQAEILLAVGW